LNNKIKKFILALAITFIFFLILRTRLSPPSPSPSPSPPPENFLFKDTYEENPTINVIGADPEYAQVTLHGDVDLMHWTEMGTTTPTEPYHTIGEYIVGEIDVTDKVARSGTRSLELVIYPLQEGHSAVVSAARYFRNDGDEGVVVEAIYEIGAHFHVPEGHAPLCSVSHEYWYDHGRIHKVGAILLNPKTGEIYAWTHRNWNVVGKVTFEPETWFKLWIKNDYKTKTVLSMGYESETQSKSFEIKEPMADIQTIYWKWDKRFFLVYATVTGTTKLGDPMFTQWDESQRAYVDDFYSKIVG